mmetsp:Transcript_23709/g.51292  ORF Transcript_23709/g.51292 Transcript_23709/m.51292 type:complete len:86 (-) Transcript_23709:78-335(-)
MQCYDNIGIFDQYKYERNICHLYVLKVTHIDSLICNLASATASFDASIDEEDLPAANDGMPLLVTCFEPTKAATGPVEAIQTMAV